MTYHKSKENEERLDIYSYNNRYGNYYMIVRAMLFFVPLFFRCTWKTPYIVVYGSSVAAQVFMMLISICDLYKQGMSMRRFCMYTIFHSV